MVEQLRPDLLQREVNVKADGVQTAFRLLRQARCSLQAAPGISFVVVFGSVHFCAGGGGGGRRGLPGGRGCAHLPPAPPPPPPPASSYGEVFTSPHLSDLFLIGFCVSLGGRSAAIAGSRQVSLIQTHTPQEYINLGYGVLPHSSKPDV